MSFNDFMTNCYYKKDEGTFITHTRIGAKGKIKGGSYYIPPDKLDKFYELYTEHVFGCNKNEYLTEVQHKDKGPILIDLDFRYEPTITKRQHNENDIIAIVGTYLDTIKTIVDMNEIVFPVYVFEKADVNCSNTSMTKDGIHIYIGITMERTVQTHLRKCVLEELPKSINLPIINSWDQVIDEGICEGYTNWQLYGSRKPDHQSYVIKYIYNCSIDMCDGEFSMEPQDPISFDIKKNFKYLSAQYRDHIEFPVKNTLKKTFENKDNCKTTATKKTRKTQLKIKNKFSSLGINDMLKIKTHEELDSMVQKIMDSLNSTEYVVKETHDFTMILPEEYYGSGSYTKWIRVGWALKNTDERLFLTWVKFSSRDNCRQTLRDNTGKSFDFNTIEYLYSVWSDFSTKNEDGLTHRSILFWAKHDAPYDEFTRVQKESVDYYVELTVSTTLPTEYDLANVLYKLFQDSFVCINIKNNIWYEFKKHRWFEIDSGVYLRKLISTDLHSIYRDKISQAVHEMNSFTEDDPRWKKHRTRTQTLANIAMFLKTTAKKQNIMKEAKDLFYDTEFIQKENLNPYLTCFTNGVFDFSINQFREGRPDDYLTKSTNYDYVPIEKIDKKEIGNVDDFFNKIYPEKELREYMWQHLASTMLGLNVNQTFNIYVGSGSNGKSMLVDLMSKVLGDYKCIVPTTLITQKRPTLGGATPEIALMKDTRYAVMQELSKGDVINEGVVKELTGDDLLYGRSLYKDMVSFIAQFKLVVCTNVLPAFRSSDDGTWRRIRVVSHKAKFVDKSALLVEDPDEPFRFEKDKSIKENFEKWKYVMASMLVEIAKVKKGYVEDCDCVLEASNNYKFNQDYISQFIQTNVERIEGGTIKKTELYNQFKEWYTNEYGKNIPKGKELYDYMEKKFGKYTKHWKNVRLIYETEEDTNEVATLL